MKKILYLSDVDISLPGGAQTSMSVIMDELSEEYDFTIITPNVKTKKAINKFKIEEIKTQDHFTLAKMNFFKKVSIIFLILSKIKKINPQIIHVQMPSTMIIVYLLRKYNLIKKGIKIYYTDRGVLDKYGNTTREIIFKATKSGVFSKVICTTNYNRNLYLEKGIDSGKILTIPNTTGNLYEEIEKRIKEKNSLKILFAGRWSPDKNWKLSYEIIKYLASLESVKEIDIVIGYDSSNLNHVNEINLYKTEVIKNINAKFNFYENVDQIKMISLYSKSNVFILSSLKESFGRTAIEAMALRNIVFGTKVDGLEEVIGMENYLYKDLEEFKEKFSRFINILNNKDINEISDIFYNRYTDNFSVKKCIELHKSLYC